MRLHKDIAEAIDMIDAALFSGDSFHEQESFDLLERMLRRWQSEVNYIRDCILNAEPEDEEPCSECGSPDCNGECFGDDMMGSSS